MSESRERGRYLNLGAVILAAGFSSRMNLWKPEARIGGIPIIQRAIVPALHICRQVVVVGGYRYNELKDLVLAGLNASAEECAKIEFVENKNFSTGMFTSVKAGMNRIRGTAEGIFLVPGDMPFINEATYRSLAELLAAKEQIDLVVPVTSSGVRGSDGRVKKGHPILLCYRACQLILKQPDESILRDVLKNISSEQCLVDDEGICVDIDDVADLEKYEHHLEN